MKTPEQIMVEVERALGKGIAAAAVFLTARVKEKLSIPAPRKLVVSRKTGTHYYRATTPAIPEAPPRKLSGTMRSRVMFEVSGDGLTARVGTNLKPYPKKHELGTHPWLEVTLEEQRSNLERIVGSEVT